MKRISVLLLAIMLIFTYAHAEEEEPKSVWNNIGSFFSNTWSSVSDFAGNAWNGAAQWIEGAWGDTSKWVEQAWNDTSTWAVDIWGDASTWVVETYESASGTVSAWWAQTFNTVTDNVENKWAWLAEEKTRLQVQYGPVVENLKAVVNSSGEAEKQEVQQVFDELLSRLGLDEGNKQKVWDTMKAYAEQKGISESAMEKLVLPYLLQLVIDSEGTGDSIPAIAVAQYLTGVVEKLGVSSNEDAFALIDQLRETLEAF